MIIFNQYLPQTTIDTVYSYQDGSFYHLADSGLYNIEYQLEDYTSFVVLGKQFSYGNNNNHLADVVLGTCLDACGNCGGNCVANENNYSVRTINALKDLDENIPGVGAQRSIVRWLYEESTDEGDFKRFNLQNGGYVVAMLTSINKAGLMSNEKASITALPAVKNKKKADLILKKINGKTLSEISSNQNQSIQTALAVNISSPTLSGVGKEPEVIGNSFGLEIGQTSKAILGNSGVFYIYLDKLNVAQDLPNYLTFSNNLSASKLNNLNTKIYEALKEVSDVEDKRSLFY